MSPCLFGGRVVAIGVVLGHDVDHKPNKVGEFHSNEIRSVLQPPGEVCRTSAVYSV